MSCSVNSEFTELFNLAYTNGIVFHHKRAVHTIGDRTLQHPFHPANNRLFPNHPAFEPDFYCIVNTAVLYSPP
jgi:hypothetical protein